MPNKHGHGIAVDCFNDTRQMHVYIGELASLLYIFEAKVPAYEKPGTTPPSEPPYRPGDARRIYQGKNRLRLWDGWKAYCEFLVEKQEVKPAGH